MKFLLFFILVINSFAFEKDYALMQTLLDRQTTLIVAINRYIEDRGAVPVSIAALRSSNYLPQLFDEKNPFTNNVLTYSIVGKRIKINSNSNLSRFKEDDKNYYINTFNNREFARVSFVENNDLVSVYTLSVKSLINLNINTYISFNNYTGDIDPTHYTNVTNGTFWITSSNYEDRHKIYVYDSNWKNIESKNKNLSPTGIFTNQHMIPLLKSFWETTEVVLKTYQKTISCAINGTTYNPLKDRCEAYTSNACASTDLFSTVHDTCYITALKVCNATGYDNYDSVTKSCTTTEYTPKILKNVGSPSYTKSINGSPYILGDNAGNMYNYDPNMANNIVYTPKCNTGNFVKTNTTSKNVCFFRASAAGDPNKPIDIIGTFGVQGESLVADWAQANVADENCNLINVHLPVCYQYGDNPRLSTSLSAGGSYVSKDLIGQQCWDNYVVAKNNSNYPWSSLINQGIIGTTAYDTGYCEAQGCNVGWTESPTQCYRTKKIAIPTTYNGYILKNLSGLGDVFVKAPTCGGKTMPVSPFYATPYYGNNGVCYSDAGLYCKKTGVSWDGLYTCFNNSLTCNDSSYNIRTDTDVCEKFIFSCDAPKNRYGLPESPTNNNPTDLYNRIINKDDKLNAVVSSILNGNVDVNDNNGAMCVNLKYSTFSQPTISPDYVIGGEVKSGF